MGAGASGAVATVTEARARAMVGVIAEDLAEQPGARRAEGQGPTTEQLGKVAPSTWHI